MELCELICSFPFQVKELGKVLFSQKIEMKLKKTEVVFDTVISSYDLTFDNSAYTIATEALLKSREGSLPVRAGILFEMFPFCILFQVFMRKRSNDPIPFHFLYLPYQSCRKI